MDWKDVVESVDIHDYVSQYVDLEEKGNEYWGLSPFQQENTPSFSIDTDIQGFYDYSSGLYGDVLTFVKAYHKVDFLKALDILMEYAGIEDDGEYCERPSILKELKKFVPKKKNKKERIGRKILPSNCMDEYVNRKGKLETWIKEGMNWDVIDGHQVKYNPFDDSLVFPIFDNDGNIINVCSRTLCGRLPKYQPYYKFGGVDFLYWEYQNRANIKNCGEVIVLEGAKSVMVAEAFGYNNCVATLTNHLNEDQLKVLIGLGVEVTFAYDKGVDIMNDKNIRKLAHFSKVNCIKDEWSLLKEKDAPIDYGEKIWNFLYERKRVV